MCAAQSGPEPKRTYNLLQEVRHSFIHPSGTVRGTALMGVNRGLTRLQSTMPDTRLVKSVVRVWMGTEWSDRGGAL